MITVHNVKVANIRPRYNNLVEWVADPNNVYIGRKGIVFIEKNGSKERYPKYDSICANPFKVTAQCTREEACQKYEVYLWNKIHSVVISRDNLLSLRCVTVICHGDVLVKIINSIQ